MKFIFKIVFGFIYKILSIFNLQPALFFCLLGIVLYFAGVFENAVFLLIYQLALILSFVYAIAQTVSKMLGLNKKVKKSKGAQIIDTDKQSENVKDEKNKSEDLLDDELKTTTEQVPKYFRVKQNPDYVMAEYPDRYELYQIQDGKLKKIRTDNKI